jgi:hypothetical protein
MNPLVAQPDYLGDGPASEAGGGRFTDRAVACFASIGVALGRGLELLCRVHEIQSSLLDKPSRKVDNTDMNSDQRHALNTANDILLGIYQTWKEGHSLDDCTKIAARVLGVSERTIDNAALYSLTGGQGFLSDEETKPAHLREGWTR